jgi:hypothetical protein
VNVKENQRDDQEERIERHGQHWAQDTERYNTENYKDVTKCRMGTTPFTSLSRLSSVTDNTFTGLDCMSSTALVLYETGTV